MAEFAFIYGNLRKDGAAQRIQSLPLLQGLQQLGRTTRRAVLDRLAIVDIRAPYVLFHYHDDKASLEVRRIKAERPVVSICFGSDLYRLDRYLSVSDIVDAFVVPTKLHREILAQAVERPVYFIPEAVDPIALPPDGADSPVRGEQNLVWFGYPESFEKSLELLANQLLRRRPDLAGRVTAISGGTLQSALVRETLPFKADRFYADTVPYSHALLSHVPYDLAVNTMIKSPNKLITGIVRGLVPIASATPAYLDIARAYGLEGQLFRTAADCEALVDAMNYRAQARDLRLDQVREALLDDFSPLRVASAFLSATGY